MYSAEGINQSPNNRLEEEVEQLCNQVLDNDVCRAHGAGVVVE
jgi:hypothetical protein